MNNIHPNYIIDENQIKKSVVLEFSEWKDILSEIEMLEDIRAYDEAKGQECETIAFEQVAKEMDRE